MIINVNHNNKDYLIDTKESIDISIPFNFNGEQPNFYDVKEGKLDYLKFEKKIYSVIEGAGCNVPEISLNIHCSGTHTEHVGHLLENPGDIGSVLTDIMIPAVLISVKTTLFSNTSESYHCNVSNNEHIISSASIKSEIRKWEEYKPNAIIIRTTPNSENKKYIKYKNNAPPFFTSDALRYIYTFGIKHLVVDVPSIDRTEDDGILGNHRIFWGVEDNAKGKINSYSKKTITELAFIPDDIHDGFYFLNIQLPHFVCDAAPSRPILIIPRGKACI